MTVVIRPENGDGQADSLKALLAAVSKVAGNEPVNVGSGGVVVSRAVARKFLNTKPSDANTSGHTEDNSRTPLITRRAGDTPGTVPADDTSIGGLTPEGDHPGGYPGVPADADADAVELAAGTSDAPPPAEAEPAPARKSTTAKKTTAAAAQRASRSTSSARSNP